MEFYFIHLDEEKHRFHVEDGCVKWHGHPQPPGDWKYDSVKNVLERGVETFEIVTTSNGDSKNNFERMLSILNHQEPQLKEIWTELNIVGNEWEDEKVIQVVNVGFSLHFDAKGNFKGIKNG